MEVTRRIFIRLAPSAGVVVPAVLNAEDKKQAQGVKPGIADLPEIAIHRSSDEPVTISVEGRVRNTGGKPIRGLTLVFHLLAPGGEEVTRQRGKIDEDSLGPGEESEFHWQMPDHARAVEVLITAQGANTFEVKVNQPGPYAIE
jgi:hypothetical protein